jgi:arylsulfatase A-like enzyme
MQRRKPIKDGGAWALALGLSFLLLAISAYQLGATLYLQGNGSEVTKAVAAGLAVAKVKLAVAGFVAAQLVLHGSLAAIVVLMANLSVRLCGGRRDLLIAFIVLWFGLATVCVLGLNALWFPRTEGGTYYHSLASRMLFGLPAAEFVGIVVAVAALATAAAAVLQSLLRRDLRNRRWVAASSAAVATLAFTVYWQGGAAASDSTRTPHVILLGIDSLRLNELARNGGTGMTPNLDSFLRDADIVADVTTPVARTFPSWVSILTGRPPRETGAIFNLVPRETIASYPTLADIFRANGYRTVLATDEVRFSNIDQSYGFDQLVTPPIGAADFLLGRITDLPLTNVVSNTFIGKWLFPYTHANRAANDLFQPSSFLRKFDAELNIDKPTFLVTHLCAAHWPYSIGNTPADADKRSHEDDRPLYGIGLQAADQMFGEIVDILERKGALRNAIVVVLSDHGEGLAVAGDSLLGDAQTERVQGLQVPVNIMDWGHGQSVLSPVQYRTLLAFRTFGSATSYQSAGRTIDAPATVLDIAPTVVDLAGFRPNAPYTYAQSLVPLLSGSDDKTRELFTTRVRFTETDLRATIDLNGDIDEAESAKQSSMYFEVDPKSGRLELKPGSYPTLMEFKERAALLGDHVLAAMPADIVHQQYLLVNLNTGRGRILERAPSPDDVDAYALWTALRREFGEELKPPIVLTADQIPELSEKWTIFLQESKRALGDQPPA